MVHSKLPNVPSITHTMWTHQIPVPTPTYTNTKRSRHWQTQCGVKCECAFVWSKVILYNLWAILQADGIAKSSYPTKTLEKWYKIVCPFLSQFFLYLSVFKTNTHSTRSCCQLHTEIPPILPPATQTSHTLLWAVSNYGDWPGWQVNAEVTEVGGVKSHAPDITAPHTYTLTSPWKWPLAFQQNTALEIYN